MKTSSEVGAAKLGCRESRGSGVPVLLCHGNSMGAEVFDPLLGSALGDEQRLIAVDLPGHGASPDAPERYSPAALVEALVEVAETLALERPVLVGHSLGGHLMVQVAHRLGTVRAVLAVGSPLLASPAAAPEAFLPHPAVGLLFQADLGDAEVEALTELLAPAHGGGQALVRRLLRRSDPRFRTSLAAALQGEYPDEVALAAGLSAPVALAVGAVDPLVSRDYLRRLSLPNLWRGEVHVIAGAGHVPMLDAPEATHELLRALLSEVA